MASDLEAEIAQFPQLSGRQETRLAHPADSNVERGAGSRLFQYGCAAQQVCFAAIIEGNGHAFRRRTREELGHAQPLPPGLPEGLHLAAKVRFRDGVTRISGPRLTERPARTLEFVIHEEYSSRVSHQKILRRCALIDSGTVNPTRSSIRFELAMNPRMRLDFACKASNSASISAETAPEDGICHPFFWPKYAPADSARRMLCGRFEWESTCTKSSRNCFFQCRSWPKKACISDWRCRNRCSRAKVPGRGAYCPSYFEFQVSMPSGRIWNCSIHSKNSFLGWAITGIAA